MIGLSSWYSASTIAWGMSAAILLESWSKYFLYLRLRVLLLAIGYFATASQLFASTYYETMLLFGCGA